MVRYKYLYGPVSSWRLGRSLGVDIVAHAKKHCDFDCVYCQLGNSRPFPAARREFVRTADVLAEAAALPKDLFVKYITFSGMGEPTLASNLGEVIKGLKGLRREPVAVLTNGTMLGRADVRRELALADLVEIKFDAASASSLNRVNRPFKSLHFRKITGGIKRFRRSYKGIFALQMMFVRENMAHAGKLAALARGLEPDIIHLNTPLRPSSAKPLSKREMRRIKEEFKGLPAVSVYDAARRPAIRPLNSRDTVRRRGRRR